MEIEQIFANNVVRIIIESYNLCNRRCYMCPQSLNIRDNEYKEFPTSVFEKLIKDLAKIDYSNIIALGRYHEPLLFPEITLKRIRFIREELPKSIILLNTNGDFITRDMVRELSIAGLSDLKIMRYQNGDYSDSRAKDLCSSLIKQLDCSVIYESTIPGVIQKYNLEAVGKMKISVKSENYKVPSRGCDRGGLIENLQNYTRVLPCDLPIKNIDIDYNGNVLPCNNLLSDALMHKPYIVGNIFEESIFQVYKKSMNSEFMRRIAKGDFSQDYICKKCSYFYDTGDKVFIQEEA